MAKILIVDDEEHIRFLYSEELSEAGYEVITADSGLGLVEKIESEKPDLVVLDMIMPGIGGGETYDRLKQLNPSIKVILASGYGLDGQAREIINRGCNGFIQKPFDVKKLTHKIREVLDLSVSL